MTGEEHYAKIISPSSFRLDCNCKRKLAFIQPRYWHRGLYEAAFCFTKKRCIVARHKHGTCAVRTFFRRSIVSAWRHKTDKAPCSPCRCPGKAVISFVNGPHRFQNIGLIRTSPNNTVMQFGHTREKEAHSSPCCRITALQGNCRNGGTASRTARNWLRTEPEALAFDEDIYKTNTDADLSEEAIYAMVTLQREIRRGFDKYECAFQDVVEPNELGCRIS